MEKISAVIITKNEETNIDRCLSSLRWADEIVVVDSGSTDGTLDICRRHGCKVFETEWIGFGKTKKFAVESASHDWILSIDADEEVSNELMSTITSLLASSPSYKGYRIKRKSYYLGKLIRYCGWQKDYPLRVFNRQFGSFNEKTVHESVELQGPKGDIHDPLYHYTYPSIYSHVEKMNRYSELAAGTERKKRRKSSIIKALIHGVLKFFKMYFLQSGILDGRTGFLLCFNSGFGVYLKYLKQWEKNR